ncbi:MAG: hypothetical protein AB1696_22910 [Planctomycetota bacterium]
MKGIPLSVALGALAVVSWPGRILADGGAEANGIGATAAMRNMGPIRTWWVNLHNSSPFWSAVISVVVIAVLGVLLSRLAEVVFAPIESRIELGKRGSNRRAGE